MKITLLSPVWLAVLACPAGANVITTTYGWTMNAAIPDNNSSGLVDVRTVPAEIASIQLLTVTLETDGGWNGDLYGYLQHDSGFSILLNRPGRTASLPAGSPASGMNVIVADAASQELHTMTGSSSVTGIWQPDGRNIDPSVVLDTTPRTALLSSFTGLDPSGTWVLFLADVSAGDQATLKSWSLSITGVAVPEPAAASLTALAALLATRRRRTAAGA